MKLRTRTLLVTGLTAFGLVVVLYIPIRWQIQESYAALERAEAEEDLARARHALDADLDTLKTTSRDYSVWDEIWRFSGPEGEPDFEDRNLQAPTYIQNRLDLFAILDEQNKPSFIRVFDRQNKTLIAPNDLWNTLSATKDGIFRSPRGPMLIVSNPIVKSSGEGPVRGRLVLGRLLTDEEVARLAREHELALTVVPAQEDEPWQDGNIIKPLTNDQLEAKSLIFDVDGKPYLALKLALGRDVWRKGQDTALWLLWALVVAGAGLGVAVAVLVERLITARLGQLSQDVSQVTTNQDHSLRVRVQGKDELATLALDINGMLASLEQLNAALAEERHRSEALLLNILPPNIADRLKLGERVIADQFTEASVLFADIVGFTTLASHVKPSELVSMLGDIFTNFDALAKRHGVEKIKTIGDAYMAVCGLPNPRPDHAQVLVEMALDMLKSIEAFNRARHTDLSIRVGINSGPVVAGVIGTQKFIYDLWGDAVNVASRMESSGLPGCIQVTEETFRALANPPLAQGRTIEVKGKGIMQTWIIRPPRSQAEADDEDVVVIGLPPSQ